jgi:soluble lytic murein transglycosylase-like protein
MSAVALAALLAITQASREHRFDEQIDAAVASVRDVYAVPPGLVRAILAQESSFNPLAESPVGARGLMQVMPANAHRLGVEPEDLWVPRKNILAGVRLLAVLLDHYRGDLISVLVAYNGRARPLFAPLPHNHETPRYVLNVLARFNAKTNTRR